MSRPLTIQQEAHVADLTRAAESATWAAVDYYVRTSQTFSYQDIYWRVRDELTLAGWTMPSSWSIHNVSTPIVREMARVGLLTKVRAFSPPSKPHLFSAARDDALRAGSANE